MLQLIKKSGFVLFCTLVLGFSVSSQTLEAATLHAVIVADTNDESIGEDVGVDADNMYYYIKRAANKSGLSSNITTFTGRGATRAQVVKQIDELKVAPDDVVIVGFHMHGYRFKDKTSHWPNLLFGESQNGLEFDYVIAKLREKNPRMFIALADVCNNKVKDGSIPTKRDIGWIDWLFGITEKRNFQKLFLNYQGCIIAAGAIPGQSSWGNSVDGGFMTTSLLESIKDVIGKEDIADVTWDAVISQIPGRVDEFLNPDGTEEDDRIEQTPLIEVQLQELSA